MPKLHQDNSSRLNLERNLRHSRRRNKEVAWKDYEASADDPRPIADPKLEYEADKSGMIYLRKNRGKTEILPGYGTTDFGISPFEEHVASGTTKFLMGISVAGLSYLLMKYRNEITEKMQVLSDYALLVREASRT